MQTITLVALARVLALVKALVWLTVPLAALPGAGEFAELHTEMLVSQDMIRLVGFATLAERTPAAGDPRLAITFPVPVPDNFKPDEVRTMLERQGYTRIEPDGAKRFTVVQDRFRFGNAERARVVEALEAASGKHSDECLWSAVEVANGHRPR